MQGITRIELPLPFRMGRVNCYLVETGTGYVLIDTGASNSRAVLEKKLEGAGCKAGNLGLIILTHGDFDHTGNAAYLAGRYGTRIAMHPDDARMTEQGDMFWNRSSGNALLRLITPLLFRFLKSDRFKADLFLEEGGDLSEYGFDARVLSIPGHSKGSIGILTAAGDLFCGDLLENTSRPAIGSIVDDQAACEASVDQLLGLAIGTVYPGHGSPFPMESFVTIHNKEISEPTRVSEARG